MNPWTWLTRRRGGVTVDPLQSAWGKGYQAGIEAGKHERDGLPIELAGWSEGYDDGKREALRCVNREMTGLLEWMDGREPAHLEIAFASVMGRAIQAAGMKSDGFLRHDLSQDGPADG